jgi:hypothetical protein
MDEWKPPARGDVDAQGFADDVELVPLPGLWATFVFLAAGGALRGHAHVAPRIAVIALAILTLVFTLTRVVRFNAERMRARGHEYPWSELVSVRSFVHRGARRIVLTFKTGVVATNSRMWRFDKLATFVGAKLYQKK